MPKYTRRTRRGRMTKRPRRSKFFRKKSIKSLARRIVNFTHEKKYITADSLQILGSTIGQSWTAAIDCFSLVPQGNTDGERDGDRLYIRSLEIHIVCYGVTPATEAFRFIIFQWYPETTPTMSGTLSCLNTASGSGTGEWLVPYNHDNRSQYRILRDVKFQLSSVGSQVQEKTLRIIKFPKRAIQFSAGSTTGSNHIYGAICSMNGNANAAIRFVYKFNFSDI